MMTDLLWFVSNLSEVEYFTLILISLVWLGSFTGSWFQEMVALAKVNKTFLQDGGAEINLLQLQRYLATEMKNVVKLPRCVKKISRVHAREIIVTLKESASNEEIRQCGAWLAEIEPHNAPIWGAKVEPAEVSKVEELENWWHEKSCPYCYAFPTDDNHTRECSEKNEKAKEVTKEMESVRNLAMPEHPITTRYNQIAKHLRYESTKVIDEMVKSALISPFFQNGEAIGQFKSAHGYLLVDFARYGDEPSLIYLLSDGKTKETIQIKACDSLQFSEEIAKLIRAGNLLAWINTDCLGAAIYDILKSKEETKNFVFSATKSDKIFMRDNRDRSRFEAFKITPKT